MASDVLSDIQAQMPVLDQQIKDGKELIKLLREVGEDTTQLEANFRDLERKQAKWSAALKSRGY